MMRILFLIFILNGALFVPEGRSGMATFQPLKLQSPLSPPREFPSQEDTLAFVDALKHSNFSDWRSLEEVVKKGGVGSCSGAVNTSVLTALYILGLYNLCSTSPISCCVPPISERRKRRNSEVSQHILPSFLNNLNQNLPNLPFKQFSSLPRISNPSGGRIRVNISLVEEVRKLWMLNPRLVSDVPCETTTEAVRASFISLSSLASGIILAYSVAQVSECYPNDGGELKNGVWSFPFVNRKQEKENNLVRSLPAAIPVSGDDDPEDGCARTSVRMKNGLCAAIFSSWACPHKQWVLFNREIGKGECVRMLCPYGRVFVEADQQCHDVNEPGFCPENQRLFLTAWGEVVCDCLDGMFYGHDEKCHRVYGRDYCDKGTVLQFHKSTMMLLCKIDPCRKVNAIVKSNRLPYAALQGRCYQFGSRGPCEDSQRFGFDIENMSPICVALEEAGILRPQRSYQYSHMSFPGNRKNGHPHYEVSYVILNGTTWEMKMTTVGRNKREASEGNSDLAHKREASEGNTDLAHKREASEGNTDLAHKREASEGNTDLAHKREASEGNTDLAHGNGTISFINTKDFPSTMKEVWQNFRSFQSLDTDMSNWATIFKNYEVSFLQYFQQEKENSSAIFKKNYLKNKLFFNIEKLINYLRPYNQDYTALYLEKRNEVEPRGKNILSKEFMDSNESQISKKALKKREFVLRDKKSTILNKNCSYANNKLLKQTSSQSATPCTLPERKKINLFRDLNRQDVLNYIQRNDNVINDKEKYRTNNENFLTSNIEKTKRNKNNNGKLMLVETELLRNNTNNALHKWDARTNRYNTEISFDNKTQVFLTNVKLPKLSFVPAYQSKPSPTRRSRTEETTMVGINPEQRNRKSIQQYSETTKDVLKSSNTEHLNDKRICVLRTRRNTFRNGRRRKRKRLGRRRRMRKRKMRKGKKVSRTNKKKSNAIKRTDRERSHQLSGAHPSLAPSLPDYLQNRDRRTPGLTPGIINAPLLNQCRPGAKRDYNGHCRARVIPVQIFIFHRISSNQITKPTPPNIKCKKNERLDTRGFCRKTYSGLG